MKIVLTGGAGDLGTVLSHFAKKRNDHMLCFDLRKPVHNDAVEFVEGSILDRNKLKSILPGVDCIVHIAAWHGYHEFTKKKDANEFWDVNVTGLFNVLQAAVECQVKKIVYISSESVADKAGIYGFTKRIGEQIAQEYVDQKKLEIITLRPRAFIPYWNQEVYQSFIAWAKWYWGGAVHIDDVAQAVLQSIDLLAKETVSQHLILPVDGAYDYTDADLLLWDREGRGSTFKKYYEHYYDLVIRHGLDPAAKPSKQDITETHKWLGYTPQYSLKNLLQELEKYGDAGPPR